jgi:hypothetical protein
MATGMTNYTMIDISYVPGNKLKVESYQVVLSRGGVNGSTDRGVVVMDVAAFESFLRRAKALLGRTTQEQG